MLHRNVFLIKNHDEVASPEHEDAQKGKVDPAAFWWILEDIVGMRVSIKHGVEDFFRE